LINGSPVPVFGDDACDERWAMSDEKGTIEINNMKNNMELKMAYCGLECNTCPIHLATLEKDYARQYAMRVEIAAQLTKIYGTKMPAVDVTDCDGCKADTGKLFTGCSDCGIRKCASLKNISNCAYCSDFECELLKKHFSFDPGSKKRLEEIRGEQNI